MKTKTLSLITMIAFTISGPLLCYSGTGNVEELDAIEGAAKLYLEGARTGNKELLSRAFHPSAKLKFVTDGSYSEWTAEQYINWQNPRVKPAFDARILNIDFTGSCASVKIEIDLGTVRFVDFLSLLKIEGEWRIVSKIFHRFEP